MKYIFAIAIISLFFISCNQRNDNQKDQIIVEDSTTVKVANQLFEKFNAHNWVGMAALYTDTAYFKDPSLGIGVVKQSRKQTIDKYTQLAEVIKDIKDSVIAIYPSSSKQVVVEFISKGTMPDGNKFELPICTILTLNNNGLIEKDFTYYNNSGNK